MKTKSKIFVTLLVTAGFFTIPTSFRMFYDNDNHLKIVSCDKNYYSSKTYPLTAGDKELFVEIERSAESQTLGLSGRDFLCKKTGMLFVFSNPSIQNFWMKDMKFPIDIVWIDKNKKIIGFKENAKPEDYPEEYPSPSPVLYVLEIHAGAVQKWKLKIGDSINFDEKAVERVIE